VIGRYEDLGYSSSTAWPVTYDLDRHRMLLKSSDDFLNVA
jgi:hypothetical protein